MAKREIYVCDQCGTQYDDDLDFFQLYYPRTSPASLRHVGISEIVRPSDLCSVACIIVAVNRVANYVREVPSVQGD